MLMSGSYTKVELRDFLQSFQIWKIIKIRITDLRT